jgi:hypothetical protein
MGYCRQLWFANLLSRTVKIHTKCWQLVRYEPTTSTTCNNLETISAAIMLQVQNYKLHCNGEKNTRDATILPRAAGISNLNKYFIVDNYIISSTSCADERTRERPRHYIQKCQYHLRAINIYTMSAQRQHRQQGLQLKANKVMNKRYNRYRTVEKNTAWAHTDKINWIRPLWCLLCGMREWLWTCLLDGRMPSLSLD